MEYTYTQLNIRSDDAFRNKSVASYVYMRCVCVCVCICYDKMCMLYLICDSDGKCISINSMCRFLCVFNLRASDKQNDGHQQQKPKVNIEVLFLINATISKYSNGFEQ